MTRPTPTRQRDTVSAGMALGLVLCGRTAIPFEKWRVDLAFEGAWRSWAHRAVFPQVNTDVNKGLDGTWAMVRADERKGTWPLFWETTGKEIEIYTRRMTGMRRTPRIYDSRSNGSTVTFRSRVGSRSFKTS